MTPPTQLSVTGIRNPFAAGTEVSFPNCARPTIENH